MPKQATGTGIPVGLAEHQVITGPAVPLSFERRAALRPPWRQPPAGMLLTPRGDRMPHSYEYNEQIDESGCEGEPGRRSGIAIDALRPGHEERERPHARVIRDL